MNGSSINMIVPAFQKNFDMKFNLIAAGSAGSDPEVHADTNPDRIVGLDSIMAEAINMKILAGPLSAEQLRTLIRMQPEKR
ncbi:hypothetical protein PY365_33460 [Roseiarcaceae bacterium H3SJ34-1]|uniref:hypothetical protein n=1 Tax=Terripilifer ovatus TaxID=3032367 RepID=UPI003AB9322E|nr:hypothetical protein [Roseiarcaceae bacterium H3SJ34-1]